MGASGAEIWRAVGWCSKSAIDRSCQRLEEKLNSLCVQFSSEENAQMLDFKMTLRQAKPWQGDFYNHPLHQIRKNAVARWIHQTPEFTVSLKSAQSLRHFFIIRIIAG